jgi:hypothetical protein
MCVSGIFNKVCKIAYFEVRDNGHRDAHVVERLKQNVGGSSIHEAYGVAQLAQQVEGFISEIDPDIARVANVLKQVAHGDEAAFLVAKFVYVAFAQ